MTQLDPRTSTETPAPPKEASQPGPNSQPPFNWHVSVVMFIGLVVLFGALFGLRALHIWPPDPGQDPEIAAAFATRAALQTQAAVATPLPAPAVAVAPAGAPTIGATPAPQSAAVQPATPTQAPVLTSTLAPQPVTAPATSAPVALPTQAPATKPQIAPTALETSVPAATGTALTLPAAGAPEATTATSAPTAPADAQPTPVAISLPADLAQGILQGYTNYWTIRVQALRDPDPASPDLVAAMTGVELARAQQVLSGYQQQGTAYQTEVKHQVWITDATNDEASILDQYVVTSSKIDPETKEPLDATTQPNVESLTTKFFLRRIDGTWRVDDEQGQGG